MAKGLIIGILILAFGFLLLLSGVFKDYKAKPGEKSLLGLKPIGVVIISIGIIVLGFNIWKEIQSAKSENERTDEVEDAKEDRRELKQYAKEKRARDSIDRARNEADRNENAISGELCAFYSESEDNLLIILGTNVARYSKSFLKTKPVKLLGGDINTDYGFQFGKDCNPITIGLKDHKIVVSGTFRDYTGSFTALLEMNNWRRNPDNRFIINRDNCAIEVVDDKLVPVLRIEFFDVNRLRISGVFYCREQNKVIVVDPQGSISVDRFQDFNSKEFLDFYIKTGERLPRLFTYTGEGWFGKRAK